MGAAVVGVAVAFGGTAPPAQMAGHVVRATAGGALAGARGTVIDAEVDSEVAMGGRAEVIAMLTNSPGARERVVDALSPASFLVRHVYQHIPALAGSVDAAGARALADLPDVVQVSVDPVVTLQLDNSVPYVGADRVRRQGFTGRGVRVAVLDTGVDTGNLDLRGAVVEQHCFIDPSTYCPPEPNVAEDSDGHGTEVSAIVASRGLRAARGVAPGADIVAVKLIEERNNAAGSATLAALDWAAGRDDLGVVNMSFGGDLYVGACDGASAFTRAVAAAVRVMRSKGTMPVAASGNDGSPTKMAVPACVEGVISVGAIEGYEPGGDPRVAGFSNRNDTLDVLAPGVDVTTSSINGRLADVSGTSASAPHVSGALALLREAAPWASADVLEDAVKQTGGRPTLRYGQVTISTLRVDLALRLLQSWTPTPGAASPTATQPTSTTAAASPTAGATRTVTVPAITPTSEATWTATATQPPATTMTPTAPPTSSALPSATATVATPSAIVTPLPHRLYLPAGRRS